MPAAAGADDDLPHPQAASSSMAVEVPTEQASDVEGDISMETLKEGEVDMLMISSNDDSVAGSGHVSEVHSPP